MLTKVAVLTMVENWERWVATTAKASAMVMASPVRAPASLVIDFAGTSFAHFSWRTSTDREEYQDRDGAMYTAIWKTAT